RGAAAGFLRLAIVTEFFNFGLVLLAISTILACCRVARAGAGGAADFFFATIAQRTFLVLASFKAAALGVGGHI
ncbi:MAG: hypothetical protein ABIS68_08525, partial [Casimicrobiaceae bacterium]